MLKRVVLCLRRQPVGFLALFLVLGGTSYAATATQLEPNSVGTREIKRRAVKTQDIAFNAVTASRIAPNAVNSDDIEDGSITATDINPRSLPLGPAGPQGPAGSQGPVGPTGPAGADGSPDTPQQILDKLLTVDGAGSGLDADLLGGLPVSAFQARVTGTCGAAQFMQSVAADGSVGCAAQAGVEAPLVLTQSAASGGGLTVNMTNPSSGDRAIDVSHAGVGPGVFATTGGNSLWGITGNISSAAVIGDSSSGEAVVARQNGAICQNNPGDCNGIGAMVGRHDGPGGYGVRGFVTDPEGAIGVLGQAGISGGTGTAVRGENVNAANNGNAVVGTTNGGGAGIFGTETSSNVAALAGRFDGNVQINGDLAVTGTKTGFQIDDPRAPAGRTLSHTPVETDTLTVVYSGNVRTGGDGRATVRLPAYAAEIAGRWRYQLTPIGTFGQAIVEREVRGGTFVVRTKKPGTKVSWSVTGTRRDAYAKAHPFRAVRQKAGAARGRYLHPDLYGQPASKGVVRPQRSEAAKAAVANRRRLASEQPTARP